MGLSVSLKTDEDRPLSPILQAKKITLEGLAGHSRTDSFGTSAPL